MKIKLTFFALLMAGTLFAQSPVLDAIKLRQSLNGDRLSESEELYKILVNYTELQGKNPGPDAIDIKFKDNPFLGENGVIMLPSRGNTATKMRIAQTASVLSSVGGLDVTTFADGLTKFLLKRFKEQVTTDFLEKFKSKIQSDEFNEFQELFPASYTTVTSLEMMNYTAYLETLREAFFMDFEKLYKTLPSLVEDKRDEWFAEHPEIGASVILGFDIAEQIQNGQHPGAVFHNLLLNPEVKILGNDFKEIIGLVDFLSQSMRGNSFTYWVDALSIRKLAQDESTFVLYLGLIYQQAKLEKLQIRGIDFTEKLKTIGVNYQELRPFIVDLGLLLGNTETRMAKYQKRGIKAENYFEYYDYISELIEMIEYGTSSGILDVFGVTIPEDLEDKMMVFLDYADLLNTITSNVLDKRYHAAVINVSDFLMQILGEKFTIKDDFIKYGTFMATVVDAEDSDEVAAAIEAIALPAGSASIKRRTDFSVFLNGYVGGAAGYEFLHLDNIDNSIIAVPASAEGDFVIGMAAPVGISFNWGNSERKKIEKNGVVKDKVNGVFTAFISILDVGALTTFRFSDSTTLALPKVKLENIFAPGIHLYYGFPNSLFTIGAGIQLGPYLRGIKNEDAALTTELQPNYRIGISLTSDISIFRFSSRSDE